MVTLKKIMSFITVVIFSIPCFCCATAYAHTAYDVAVISDITAFIDYTPVRSCNIGGYTYVIAEELIYYGFDVVWNETDRTLNINRKTLDVPVYTKELFDMDFDKPGVEYNIYPTNIKTYLNGEVVNGYNIGGQTVVQIDELSRCGFFEWDEDVREVNIMIYEAELQEIYDRAPDKTEIDITDKTSYIGQINGNGKPEGIGLMCTDDMAGSAGVSYLKSDKVLGYFKDGKPNGKIFLERFLSAGKTGESIIIKFVGETDGTNNAERRVKVGTEYTGPGDVIRENNFGNVALPYYYMRDYIGAEVFPDTQVYLNGVWFEDNGYRGQSGVTFRSWFDGENYQSILKTENSKRENWSFEEQVK